MYNLIFHHWGLKLHLSLGKFESILSPNQTGTNILLSECPIAHFSDCHTRLLTTVTTYHQEFSIFPSLKPYSFTHFLLVASSFFLLQHLFYGFTMNSSEPLHSHTLSPLLSHTNNNQLPVCSDKVGKKIKNLNFETLPSLKQLFPGQQCWPRWLWLSHWTWHRAFYWAAPAASWMLSSFPHIGLILHVLCLETWTALMEQHKMTAASAKRP